MESITLNFTDYRITGVASVISWGGGQACIEMKPFHIKDINKISVDDLNDNGFGVEKITGAYVYIEKNYEGHYIFDYNMEVGKVFNCVYDYLNEI